MWVGLYYLFFFNQEINPEYLCGLVCICVHNIKASNNLTTALFSCLVEAPSCSTTQTWCHVFHKQTSEAILDVFLRYTKIRASMLVALVPSLAHVNHATSQTVELFKTGEVSCPISNVNRGAAHKIIKQSSQWSFGVLSELKLNQVYVCVFGAGGLLLFDHPIYMKQTFCNFTVVCKTILYF